jgi:hypothetical protein
MDEAIKKEGRQHTLNSRLYAHARIKWISTTELISRYGKDINPVQLEILQQTNFKYPVNE